MYMKKAFLALLLCAVLCLAAAGTAMAATASCGCEAHWGTQYYPVTNHDEAPGYGTLAQALAAAQQDPVENDYITLLADIENANYTLTSSVLSEAFTLDLDGFDVAAASGKSAFTLGNNARMNVNGYSGIVTGGQACFTVNGEDAVLQLGTSLCLSAANNKPAVVVKKGNVLVEDVSFTNAGASCDILYQNGALSINELCDFANGISIHNASAESMPIAGNIIGEYGLIVLPDRFVLHEKGTTQTAAVFEKGKTYTLYGPVRADFEAGWWDEEGNSPAGFAIAVDEPGVITIPELPEAFENPDPDVVFAGWSYTDRQGEYLTVQPGEQFTLDANYYFDGQWNESGVKINDTPLLEGQYMDNNGVVSTTKPNGGYAYFSNFETLILHNFVGTSIEIDENTIFLTLEGSSSLTNYGVDTIEVDNTDLVIRGNGSLTLRALEYEEFTCDGIDMENGCLYLTGGKLTIEASDKGIELDWGDGTEASCTINGTTLNITAGNDGIDVEADLIMQSGTVNINAAGNGIDADDEDSRIYVTGGTLNIHAREGNGMEAVSTGGSIEVVGGTILINAGDNAVKASEISITGGQFSMKGANRAIHAELRPTIAARYLHDLSIGTFDCSEDEMDCYTLLGANNVPVTFWNFLTTPPSTGDSTPVALLALLMALSLTGCIILRKRFN